jgi:hypothetical protein
MGGSTLPPELRIANPPKGHQGKENLTSVFDLGVRFFDSRDLSAQAN